MKKFNSTIRYRLIPFGIVLLFFCFLLLSFYLKGSYTILGSYFIPNPLPYFVDLKILLYGIDVMRAGQSPYQIFHLKECGEILYNYPSTWSIFTPIKFLTLSNSMYIAYLIIIAFFLMVYMLIGKIYLKESIVYSLILLSPAILLALDRANCDLIIFILLAISILNYKSQIIGLFSIFIGTILKLYPIGAIISLFFYKVNKKSILLAIVTIVITFGCLFIMINNIITVSKSTPRPYGVSTFGIGTFPSLLSDYFINFFNIHPKLDILFTNFESYKIKFIHTIILFIHLIITYLFVSKYWKRIFSIQIAKNQNGFAFIIGSSIFLTAFLIGYNFEYRLIFLIFTIPQIFEWFSTRKNFSTFLILLTLICLWQSTLSKIIFPLLNIFYIIKALFFILFITHLILITSYLLDFFNLKSNR